MQYIKTKASVSGIAKDEKSSLLANASFKVLPGKIYQGQTPVATFITDNKGNFFLELKVGSYCIVEQERPESFSPAKDTETEKWDNACLKKKWQTPLAVLNIKSNDASKIELRRSTPSVNPCLKN